VYSHRNYLTTLHFVKTVLKYCKNKPVFVVDKGPWYKGVFERLGLDYEHESFGRKSKIESVFSSYKQRANEKLW